MRNQHLTHRIRTEFQNGIQTVLERTRKIMIHAGLPPKLWPEAITAACYLTNRLPTKALGGKTPYEVWNKRKPDLSNLRVLGCDAYVVDYQAKFKGKMAPRSWAETLVGYEAKNQWKIYDGKTVFVSRDVIFNESTLTYKKTGQLTASEPKPPLEQVREFIDLKALLLSTDTITLLTQPTNPTESLPLDHLTDLVTHLPEEATRNKDAIQNNNLSHQAVEEVNQDISSFNQQSRNQVTNAKLERIPLILNYPRRKPKVDYKELNTRGFATLAETVPPHHGMITPKTYEEAINGPQKEQWIAAMKEEVQSQLNKGTFIITKPPYDEPIIPGKWDFKIKENWDGSIARFKAGWVAKGYEQVEERGYDKKVAPINRPDTSRILLSVAATKNWKIRQFDIKTAFLNSQIDLKLYSEEPKGHETREGNACLLNTALYGAHFWFNENKSTLLAYGLKQSKHDDALFFDSSTELYVTIYVDDIKVFAPTNEIIDDFSAYISKKYELTNPGDLKCYLGMEIGRLKDGSIILTQTKYIRDILHKHGVQNCAKVSTPMTGVELTKRPKGYECDKDQRTQYQSLLGELTHLMEQTRPDLAYCVSHLAQFASNPTQEHWLALKHVLRYLKGTKDLGICYSHAKSNLTMEVWTDSSGRVEEDWDAFQSIQGYLVLIAGGPLSWNSSEHQWAVKDIADGKYMAQTMAAKQTMWARGLLQELQIEGTIPKEATVMYVDDQEAIQLAQRPRPPTFLAKMYHYTNDLIQQNEIRLEYRKPKEMIATGLTEPLGATASARFVKSLGLTSIKGPRKARSRKIEGLTDGTIDE